MPKRSSGKGSKVTPRKGATVVEETNEELAVDETLTAAPIDEEGADVDAAVIEAADADEASLEDVDDDVDGSEETEEAKEKKRRGKRQVYYDCAANVTLPQDMPERSLKAGDKALVLEPIPVTMPENDNEFDRNKARTEAISLFVEKYGVEPEGIHGPVYNMKGIVSAPRKRETINVTVAKEAPFIAERGKAIHRFKDHDWNVLVNFTTRPDTVYVFYDTLVDPKKAPQDKSKFQKPTPKFLPITALRNLQRDEVAAQ